MTCLETLRVQIAQAETVAGALQSWSEETPVLVVVDMTKAGGDGLEVCTRLRELDIIPILLLIPHYDEHLALRSYQAGVDEVLVKPLSPALLSAKVCAWLRHS